jgi:hypothetical protein
MDYLEFAIGVVPDMSKVDRTMAFKLFDYLNTSTTTSYTISDDGVVTITGLSDSEKTVSNVDTTPFENNTEKVDTSSSGGLKSVLKSNTDSTNSRLDIQNDLITAKLVLMNEQNQLLAKQIDAVNQQNKILETQVQTTLAQNKIMLDYNQTVGAMQMAKDSLSIEKKVFEINGNDDLVDDSGSKIIPIRDKAVGNNLGVQKKQFELKGSESVKNSSDEKIIPIHEKAKYHSEKRIDEERANKTDYSKITQGFIDDAVATVTDEDNAFNLLGEVFTLPTDYEIPNNLVEG